jgi:hypothetical protein
MLVLLPLCVGQLAATASAPGPHVAVALAPLPPHRLCARVCGCLRVCGCWGEAAVGVLRHVLDPATLIGLAFLGLTLVVVKKSGHAHPTLYVGRAPPQRCSLLPRAQPLPCLTCGCLSWFPGRAGRSGLRCGSS